MRKPRRVVFEDAVGNQLLEDEMGKLFGVNADGRPVNDRGIKTLIKRAQKAGALNFDFNVDDLFRQSGNPMARKMFRDFRTLDDL